MRSFLMTLFLISGLPLTTSAYADHWDRGPGHGGGHRRPPNYLCQGTFWGGFSNGARANFTIQPRGRNHVDVYINIDGGYQFSGQGTCDSFRDGRTEISFFVQGPGTGWGRGWGNIWMNGRRTSVEGRMENGLNFHFQR